MLPMGKCVEHDLSAELDGAGEFAPMSTWGLQHTSVGSSVATIPPAAAASSNALRGSGPCRLHAR